MKDKMKPEPKMKVKTQEHKRASYTLDPAAAAVLELRSSEGWRSNVLSNILLRYDRLCRRSRPPLTKGQWGLILDVLNGIYMMDTIFSPRDEIMLNVHDGIEQNRYDQKWEINGKELLDILQQMSDVQMLAVLDEAECFWSSVSRGENPEIPDTTDLREAVKHVRGEKK